MKGFHDKWTTHDINDYLDYFKVLVLFDIENVTSGNNDAKIIIHGNMTYEQRTDLMNCILDSFGGKLLSDDVCNSINDYAEKWYNKNILNRRARVINIKVNKL